MKRPAQPVTSRIFFACYVLVVVVFLLISHGSSEHGALAMGLDRLGFVAQLIGTGAQGTAFPLTGTLFLLLLMPLNLLHSAWILARSRRVVSAEEVARSHGYDTLRTRSLAATVAFALFWVLIQATVFLIPANVGALGRLTSQTPLAYAIATLVFLYVAHLFLTFASIGWRDLAEVRRKQAEGG